MKYNPDTRTLETEPKDCRTCLYGDGEQGQYTRTIPCPDCEGTGRGPRGGRRGCRTCSGSGNSYDWGNPIACPACNGNYQGHDWETFTDVVANEVVLQMPMRVVRLDRNNTWNELYLGLGCLFSVTDYGRMSKVVDDADVIAQAADHLASDRTQASKIVKPYAREDRVATLHDELVVTVTNDGWAIRALSDLEPQEA